MRRAGRGSTGPGRRAALPQGDYAVPATPAGNPDLVVDFHGDDGRKGRFDCGTRPLPDWRPALAAAFAQRTGPDGGRRTLSSATSAWQSLGRLMRFLAKLPVPPARPQDLTSKHLEAFLDARAESAPTTVTTDLREIHSLFVLPGIAPLISPDATDCLKRRLPDTRIKKKARQATSEKRPKTDTVGYSDGELARLMAALRADCARIRNRIAAGEELLRRFQEEPQTLSEEQRAEGQQLAHMAATGEVPSFPGPVHEALPERLAWAGRLFLTLDDLVPLLLLMAALAERNGETVKELPARHRVLEGKAVEVRVVKRRRGPKRWFETVTWEIGPANRQLHTAGGFYLLLLQLAARSRQFCESDLAVCVWRHGTRAGVQGREEHCAPFARSLQGVTLLMPRWAADRPRPLLADPGPGGERVPLQVTFNRLKTSMEVRRTKRMGGHLPSAAKSNTMAVLFRHYLSGDPVITEWAEEVLGEALVDAEQAALHAHQQALKIAGNTLKVVSGPVSPESLTAAGLDPETAEQAAAGQLDTGWTACTDHDHHPVTEAPCQVTFLDCFHCGNCLITRDHLPHLLGLLDALVARRRHLSVDDWWKRYGPAWAAIRRDILAKFTPAEVKKAAAAKATDDLLDLTENPWEL
ncbi:hypothetical protein [Streptomyces sp. SPB162]|uniref:hypothetical protein n=1 Tax=Streptomyces sp. SPB162 TaxID=2940560 RepID=UPI002405B5A6|nr:hypothetical protein [Streptomyces sp. SPB162]MDF9815947.1 hypothetical protein [Streptomyces sp. SPB162]